MKKTLVCTYVLSALLSPGVSAALEDENGFSGEASFLVGAMSAKSNFNTGTDTKKGALNSEGESETEGILVPLGQLNYTFGQNNNHQIFIGLDRDDIAVGDAAFEIGYKTELSSGMVIATSFLPTVVGGETWENQYSTGKRTTTDVTGNAFRLNTESIMGSNFDLDLAYYTSDIDKDFYKNNKNLARSGNGIYSKTSYNFSIDETSRLVPSVIYTSFSADGKAESNKAFGLEIAYQVVMGRHAFSVSTDFKQASYDAVHETFNIKRKDNSYGVFSAYEYENFMGWENWNGVALAGYEVQSSNINFYDESEYLVGAGVNYKF